MQLDLGIDIATEPPVATGELSLRGKVRPASPVVPSGFGRGDVLGRILFE